MFAARPRGARLTEGTLAAKRVEASCAHVCVGLASVQGLSTRCPLFRERSGGPCEPLGASLSTTPPSRSCPASCRRHAVGSCPQVERGAFITHASRHASKLNLRSASRRGEGGIDRGHHEDCQSLAPRPLLEQHLSRGLLGSPSSHFDSRPLHQASTPALTSAGAQQQWSRAARADQLHVAGLWRDTGTAAAAAEIEHGLAVDADGGGGGKRACESPHD